MMENILITGAAGFIGTKLAEELSGQQCNIYALIEKGDSAGKEKLYALNHDIHLIDDAAYLFEHAASFPAFNKIFHLATVGVRPDFEDMDLICDVNIKMSCRLVRFAKDNHSRLLVNFGSCFEYGDHGGVLLTEDMHCAPASFYAISKNASTELVTAYAKNLQVNAITVRPFGVFGEGEGPERLAPSVIRSCMAGNVIKTTPGEQVRDFVNVRDLVRAVIRLSQSAYRPYEIYNICSDNPVKVRDFILEIVDVCGFDRSLIDFGSIPYRKNEAMVFAGDNQKLQSIIHYPFPGDHRDGILEIYHSMKTEE